MGYDVMAQHCKTPVTFPKTVKELLKPVKEGEKNSHRS